MEPDNVSEVMEARTMRRRGNGVYKRVKDVIRADVCPPYPPNPPGFGGRSV